jgi:hypothetical protein
MPFTYQSGEEIQRGDRVLFHDEPGEIEFVAADVSACMEKILSLASATSAATSTLTRIHLADRCAGRFPKLSLA